MAANPRKDRRSWLCRLWLVLSLGVGAVPLGAQPVDDDEDAVVGQTLTWEGNEYVLRYEVTVVNENGDQIFHEDVEQPSVSLMLKPGTYRYQVLVYNLLDQLEATSPWVELVVLRAEIPRPRSFGPQEVYLEDPLPKFTIRGTLLRDGAQYTLTRQDRPDLVLTGQAVSHPSDEEVVIEFPDAEFSFGEYSLTVTNPGGLKRSLKDALRVRYEKPIDFRLAAGLSPVIPLYDDWYKSTWSEGWYPLGLSGRFEVMFLKRSEDQWGLGLDGDLWWQTGGLETAVINSRYASTGLSVVYQYLFTKEIRAGGRLGGGVIASWHRFDYEGLEGVSWGSLDLYANAEVNGSYYFNKFFYAQFGLEWFNGFNNGFVAGMLKPVLLAGLSL